MDDLTPPHWGTTMTFDEAYEAAVLGERVRATNMAPGVYIDYQFNGLRINHPHGASSGWRPVELDMQSEWETWQPPVKPAWPDLPKIVKPFSGTKVEWQKPKPVASNPWAEAGLTSEPKPVVAWPILQGK